MASSCNRPQHRRDRRSSPSPPPPIKNNNRFTSSSRMMHFHNSSQTLAAAAMFVAVLLMSHHPVLCEEVVVTDYTTDDVVVPPTTISPQITSTPEITTNDDQHSLSSPLIVSTGDEEVVKSSGEKTEPVINLNGNFHLAETSTTRTVINTTDTLQSVSNDHYTPQESNITDNKDVESDLSAGTDLQHDHNVLSGLSADIEQPDVNNDIFSAMVEVSPEIKTSPDFIDSQPGKKVPESTENLEQSIRNSVKTEIEMEQGSESSPVLDILKDISEPEIRQTLTEDLIEPVLSQNDVTPKYEKATEDNADVEKVEDQSQEHPEIPVEINDEEFEAKIDESNPETENTREARNMEINESKIETSDSSSSSSSSSSESNSLENSHEPKNQSKENGDENESEVDNEPLKSNDDEIEEKKQLDNPATGIKPEETEADLTIPETSEEVLNALTTPATDIAFLEDEELTMASAEEGKALSVVLEESLSSTVPINEDETLMNVEQKDAKTSLDIIAAEEEEATVLPEESEHIVIKKVLDEHDIFVDVPGTTVLPVARDLGAENQPVVIIEEPTPTIIEEETPVPEEGAIENVHDSLPVEDSHQTSEVVTPLDVVEEPKPANDGATSEEPNQKEALLNDNNAEIKSNEEENLATETATSENPIAEEANAEKTDAEDEPINDPAGETIENAEEVKPDPDAQQHNGDDFNTQIIISSTTESAYELSHESPNNPSEESFNGFNMASTTAADPSLEISSEHHDIVDEIPVEDVDYSKTVKGSRSVNTPLIDDDAAATMFEAYPPQDAGQTFNDNLADESSGIGKALPVSINDGSNRSTTIIILSSGTAFLFIVISVTIFLISFQRQHGTLDIEMQERSCGKDNLDEEDAETFAKLLEVELPPSVAIALEETEECL